MSKVDVDIGADSISSSDEILIPSALADATLAFMEENDTAVAQITPEQEKKLKKKLFLTIFCFVSAINLLLYMDKATLSYDSILGFFEDTGLTQDTYNTVNTLFYVGFAIGQFPGQYLAQKLPLGKFLAGILATWTVLVFLLCTAYNFSGVVALRFFLGMTESVVIPILITTMGMFFNASERAAAQPFFFAACMGSPIPTGFIAYGVLHITNPSVALWRIFTIIIAGLTFIMTIVVFLWFPNNPADAKFFTVEERVWIIRRVQASTGSSIEQKVFKKSQFKEAMNDYITWLFGLFFLLQQLANNLPYQQNLLFEGMGGVDALGSTLVSVAGAGFAVVCALIASLTLMRWKNISALTAIFWTLPALVGSIAAAALPWDNKIGILANICMAGQIFGIPFIIALSWASSSASGYTKKLTRSSVCLFAMGIANIISPQIWRAKDAPRYLPAWIVQIVLSFSLAPLILLLIHFILKRRNNERLKNYDENFQGYVNKYQLVESDTSSSNEKGVTVAHESNLAVFDLTDLENKTFIYPL
ncbi:hypothetical protein SUVZ_12G0060 [Saccharomyces uvarum]|uniref:High affinity cysteine transporter n=1 Tax=Saccharomyces uvarum TaxID=230603 RepID=A0ABN8WMR3_SACUV|nr:hypothetical protein SUVZ_12G0060 [Saccharomyces uvarum]